ncbi:hypothetical protein L1887_15040 [Cichorium endivia]|nr:hypothetical protein L1887_15040 [Cichorium endivia]
MTVNHMSLGQFVRVEDGQDSEEKSGNTEKDADDSFYEFQDEEGKELVVIQEVEHLNHISPEYENINNENEEGYNTPIAIRVETLESTHSLSSTQFFDQPGVLEEVEDMILKATSKSSEEKTKDQHMEQTKTKMNAEAGKVEEEQENIEKKHGNVDKGKQKRQPKISKQKCSPYVQRISAVDVGVKKEELNLYQALITSTKDVE